MKRTILSAAVLLLLITTAVLASAPPAVFLQDGFEGYGAGTRLRACPGPGTLPTPGWETPVDPPWNTLDPDSAGGGGTGNLISADNYCAGAKSVLMSSVTGNGSRSRAQTQGDMTPLTTGVLTRLHFTMKAGPAWIPPEDHCGVWLIDASNTCIVGWRGGATTMCPKTSFMGAEGTPYTWATSACVSFDVDYDPATGDAKWYADDVLVWSTTIATGLAAKKVYVRDKYIGDADNIYLDDLVVGTTSKPTVTAPIGGAFQTTTTPTVTWDHAFATPASTGYQVRVCSADDSAGPVVYDSGQLTPAATSITTTALPANTQLWAFVNEQYPGGWSGWSLQGNGGFYCVTSAPSTPTVTAPSGTVVGAKPAVVFSDGVLHNQFKVKITTDLAGSVPVWPADPEATIFTSLKNGASCPVMLTPGTQYYAFARAGNPVLPDGWSAWSAPSAFQVTRTGEGTDVRNMDEKWGAQTVYEHIAFAPDDGFGQEISTGMNWTDIKWQVLPDPFNVKTDYDGFTADYQPCDWRLSPYYEGGGMLRDDPGYWVIPPAPNRAAPSYVYDLWDTEQHVNSNSMRRHRVADLSLDKGVTLTSYAKSICLSAENCGGWFSFREVASMAQFYICDDYETGKCMASFRYAQGSVGICNDGLNWTDVAIPGAWDGWHLVRITGRNRVVGDPTTAEWNYYVDENPTPLSTRTGVDAGSIDQAVAPGVPGWMADSIAIGNGCGGLTGNWQYDWTAVNTDGDYAPGEWFIGGEFATVSAAKGASGPITIAGDTVITGVNKDATDSQIGFSVQDVGTQDHAGLYIPSTSTDNILVGNIVRGIGGVMSMQSGVGATMQGGFTATTETAEALPLAMTQKSLQGYRTPPAAGLNNAGMYVRICGRVTAWLPNALGIAVVYLDDGSGLVDGRSVDGNPSALGLRIVTDQFFDGPGSVGNYYRVDGVCTCETWTEGATTKTVETILAPRFEQISEP